MILEQLLGSVSRAAFLEQHYLKLPFARAGGCQHLTEVAGWPLVEAVLQSPAVDFLAARPDGVWGGDEVTPSRARALLGEGYTLRIRQAERHSPALAELAGDFRRELGGEVDVHVYCTPAN